MKTKPTNRRDFIKQTTFASAGLGFMVSKPVLAETFLQNKTAQAAAASNYSIQNVATEASSSTDFNGDDINRPHDILWDIEGYVSAHGGWPQAERHEKIVVVGGGMAGLLSTYFLKDHKPLLLEQDSKIGGNSKGEIYNKSMYSIGAAYVTVPDEGSSIQTFFKNIGLLDKSRVEEAEQVKFLYKNEFTKGFWQGATDPARAHEFVAVADELKRIYDNEYPDIPWTSETAMSLNEWKALDQISFQQWLSKKWPNLHPHILEFFQLYGWSSFNGSIDELSALQMLNFITAETVGIWAFPAGNSLITYSIHKELEKNQCPVESLAFVVQVKTNAAGVLVTYVDSKNQLKAIQCDQCVVAAPKFVANKIVPELSDEQQRLIEKISYRGYLVANVILNRNVPSEGYDIFCLSGSMPEAPLAFDPPVKGFTDVVFGSWAQSDNVDQSVLSLYRPLPYDGARQFLFNPAAYEKTKLQIAPDLKAFLTAKDLSESDIKGIRLTRWGHSLPVAHTNLLASGTLDTINKNIKNKIFFANQDNFANPAFETAFAAAEIATGQILKLIS